MKVSPSLPFQLVYSLYNHEYLGYLFESYVIQLDEQERLTYSHQNISSKNAKEFANGLQESDYELIRLMDSTQQEIVINHFSKKKIKPAEFFPKIYDKETGNKDLQNEINGYLDRRRSKILSQMSGKMLFEMARDGEPAWKQLQLQETPAFHIIPLQEKRRQYTLFSNN